MLAHDLDSPIHRISVEQFHRMIEAGCFGDGDRVELIDGEMRDMTPIGPPHQGTTDSLNMRFATALARRAIVRVQGPVVLDDGTSRAVPRNRQALRAAAGLRRGWSNRSTGPRLETSGGSLATDGARAMTNLTIPMSEQTADRLAGAARAAGRTPEQLLLALIEHYLEDQEDLADALEALDDAEPPVPLEQVKQELGF